MARQTVNLSRVHIKSHSDGTITLTLDDKDVSQKVMEASLYLGPPGNHPRLVVEYACHEQLTFDGVAEVVHVCPKKAR